MKIRTGFVSNSSSSSFLVVYKSLKDFEKLDRFEGYKSLIKDLSESSSIEGFDAIYSILWHHVYENLDGPLYFGFFNYGKNIWDLKTLADVDVKLIDELTDMCKPIIEDFNNKIFNKYPDKKPLLLFVQDRYRICMSPEEDKFIETCREEARQKFFWEDAFQNALEKKIQRLSETILGKLHSKGYTVRAVRYADDSQEDAMMEHDFMPFIANNPEREYEVFTINEH